MLASTNTSRSAILILSALLAQSCGWVDSAGTQSARIDNPAENPSASVDLLNAQPVAVMEQATLTARLVGTNSSLPGWQWSPTTSDLPFCESVNGFDYAFAESSLEAACADDTDCEISITEYDQDGTTHFAVAVPQLKAPVQLDYELSAIAEDGTRVIRTQSLCALSVNEAPDAKDDLFIALADQILISQADDPDSLLANDEDDQDNRNQALRVNPVPVEPPRHALKFTLLEDGGFLYSADDSILSESDDYIEDQFVYAVTDGLHIVNATATIRIVRSNQIPVTTEPFSDVELTATDDEELPSIQINLLDHFTDPDGDTLHFSIDRSGLPETLSTEVNAEGQLTLTADADSAGSWLVTVNATDGVATAQAYFMVYVVSEQALENQAPVAQDINNRRVQDTFTYDISVFFDDPDGDVLFFTEQGLPDGVSLSSDGVISGSQNQSNLGSWFVTVTADDGRGLSVSDSFRLTIN